MNFDDIDDDDDESNYSYILIASLHTSKEHFLDDVEILKFHISSACDIGQFFVKWFGINGVQRSDAINLQTTDTRK